jgi:adenylate kinase
MATKKLDPWLLAVGAVAVAKKAGHSPRAMRASKFPLLRAALASAAESAQQGFSAQYMRWLETMPIRTKAISAFLMAGTGNAFGQIVSGGLDLGQTLRYALVCAPPYSHFWYMFLGGLNLPGGVFTKVVIDQVFWRSFMIWWSFVSFGLVSGHSSAQIKETVSTTFVEAWKKGILMWTGISFFNQSFVPPLYQTVVNDCFSFCWDIYMTIMLAKDKKRLAGAAAGKKLTVAASSVAPKEVKEELPEKKKKKRSAPKSIILIGPPGCGKGTQSPKIVDKYNYVHLATGDMLRMAVMAGTTYGKKAKDAMRAGKLVTDDIVIGIISDAIKENLQKQCKGFIFDGFPRTVEQAKALDEMLGAQGMQIDHAINFAIPDDVLVERVTGRWIHKKSGRSYHIKFNPPKMAGKDDLTGEPLMQRKDDNEKTLVSRLQVFHAQTKPVLTHYAGVMSELDANTEMESVESAINLVLGC